MGKELGRFIGEFHLFHLHTPDNGLIKSTQNNRLPNATRDKPGTPVPAEMVLGFAGIHTDFLITFNLANFRQIISRDRNNKIEGIIFFESCLYRRFEKYPQCVRTRYNFLLNIYIPFPEHVIGSQDPLIVQKDFCVGIQTLEMELNNILPGKIRTCLEGGLVFPIHLVDPLQVMLIEPVKGIFYLTIIQQIGMDTPGYCGL